MVPNSSTELFKTGKRNYSETLASILCWYLCLVLDLRMILRMLFACRLLPNLLGGGQGGQGATGGTEGRATQGTAAATDGTTSAADPFTMPFFNPTVFK